MTPVILIVLDGYGLAPPGPGNAIYLANPPNLNSYFYSYPNTTLKASGENVGLPAGEVGNTEVGHLNLGAGRIVFQDLPRINMAIADGSFYNIPSFANISTHLKETRGNLHFIGLLSEGTVHSCVDHLFALLFLAKEKKIKNVYIHVITDGRDSPPKSSLEVIKRVEDKIKDTQNFKIASVIGRYYAMDRDRRWERTEKAYACLTHGSSTTASSATEAVTKNYQEGRTDEFIEPTNIVENDKPIALIQAGDAVVFFNYRIDRPRQLTKAFVLDNFEEEANKVESFDPYAVKYYKTHLQKEEILNPPFKRGEKIKNLCFCTLTEYEKNLTVNVAFPPVPVTVPLGRVLAENNISQLRMCESEKERFVTFYFNGQNEIPYPQEERLIVPSPKVPTYDLKPEMSAYELTELVITKMREQKHQFILLNFANPDMVGHSGNIEATILAIKAVDNCVGKIVSTALSLNFTVLITADHGNAELKINHQTSEISTEHTSSPVPFIAINNQFQGKYIKLQSGILADVATTVLALLDIPKPESMTGRNLLEEIT